MAAMTVDEDGDWAKAGEDDYIYKFTTEYAKSSHATCRLCSEKIKKDTVRVGVPVKWGGGTNGFINAWQHLICARSQDGEEVTKDEIWGIEKLFFWPSPGHTLGWGGGEGKAGTRRP